MAANLPPFASLLDAHGSELLAYARRLAGQDGEDVLHDALLRALRAYPRLAHGEHLRAWLYRITTHAAYDHHTRRARRREVLVGAPPDAAVPEEADDAFEALIADLPDGARGALTLRFVDDLSYDDIARRLDCSPEAARQRVSSAIQTLRARLT